MEQLKKQYGIDDEGINEMVSEETYILVFCLIEIVL